MGKFISYFVFFFSFLRC